MGQWVIQVSDVDPVAMLTICYTAYLTFYGKYSNSFVFDPPMEKKINYFVTLKVIYYITRYNGNALPLTPGMIESL